MIKLEGIVLNVFTQQGGQNKKVKLLMIATRYKFLGAMDLPNGDVKNGIIYVICRKLSGL